MKRLCIYVIYDKQQKINAYIEAVLRELKRFVTDIIVVCNFERILEGEEHISPYASRVFFRENTGFDAGAYKDALLDFIAWDKALSYDELLLTNDTYFAPIYPMDEMFRHMENEHCDFWGITKNSGGYVEGIGNLGEHIQSFFLAFKNAVFHSEHFRCFWDRYTYAEDKYHTILSFEIGINVYLAEKGYTGSAYMDHYDLPFAQITGVNPYTQYAVEIGGSSFVFKNNIYEVCNRCDGVNYSTDTVWWKTESSQYIYDGQKLGDVIISDVVDLSIVEDEKYDFCISSNNLEHVANPIKALKEQKRIVQKGGLILVIVPMKSKCFDHNRDFTEFEHLLEDYTKQISEDDMTHLDEIMDKHDFDMDPACGGKEKFAQRAMKNYENRCLHHHVFNTDTLTNMYRYLDIKVLNAGRLKANYYIIGEK